MLKQRLVPITYSSNFYFNFVLPKLYDFRD